jgi:hypothetical protein
MVVSSFHVWLVVGEFVREGMVPFLYCSFWFVKSGKRGLGAMGVYMHRGQDEDKGAEGEDKPRPYYGTASQAGARSVAKERHGGSMGPGGGASTMSWRQIEATFSIVSALAGRMSSREGVL